MLHKSECTAPGLRSLPRASPTFYDKPKDFTAAADQIAARILDLLGLEPVKIKRWREK